MKSELHLAHFFRYLWDDSGLLIVAGNATELVAGHRAYEKRYGVPEISGAEEAVYHRFLACAGLAALSLAERESWGWSLALPDSPLGLFCAVEPEGMLSGTVLESDYEKRSAVVQRQSVTLPMTQSHFELDSPDPPRIVEAYFEECTQLQARVALDGRGECVLAQSMPQGQFAAVDRLSDGELLATVKDLLYRSRLKMLEEVLLFYECRCSDEMIYSMVNQLPEEQRRDLWGDEPHLKVSCPRCRRLFTVHRRQ